MKQKTILLVEDQATSVMVVTQQLQRFGYNVVGATSGKQAIELGIRDEMIDLILMDILLGDGIDGTEAAKQILAKRNIPIVFLSSHKEREIVERVRGISRYGYVLKNSDEFVLRSSIEMVFELFDVQGQLKQELIERKRAEDLVGKRLITLTQPLEGGTIALEDLFRLDEIQRIQDEFAFATCVASIITLPDGIPYTKPSNFTRLCNDIIRKTEQGCLNCFKSDAAIGRYNSDGPIVQQCLSGGLWDAGASIIFGGQHIANWLIGQVRDETQTEENMRAYARFIGAEEQSFMNAFLEVPSMPRERFEQIARALFTLANQLSTTAFQNIQQARFITERKMAEDALRESESRFRGFFDFSPLGINVFDMEGKVVAVNNVARSYFGVAEDDPLSGYRFFEDSSVTDETKWKVKHGQVATEERYIDFDVIKKSGMYASIKNELDRILIRTTYVAYGPDIDNPLGIIAIIEDTTERKKAEDSLRQSEDQFKKLFVEAPLGIALIDSLTGHIFEVNPMFAKIAGRTIEEMAQIDWMSITHPDDVQEDLDNMAKLNAGTIHGFRMDKRYLRPDGTVVWISMTIAPMQVEDTAHPRHLCMIEDITERRQVKIEIQELNTVLEERVITRTAQLEAANKDLEAFAYSVSHDLRAPLRGIDGWSHALLEDYGGGLNAEAQSYIHRVRSEVQRMSQLIDDLLNLSRLTRAEVHHDRVDMSAIANTIVGTLQEGEPQRDAEFCIQPGLSANGDARLLEVVLTNLLGNAFKFTSKNSHARIELGQTVSRGKHAFFVRDNGAGFDMAFAGKLFGAFQRMHKTSEFPGSGIGLVIAQRIIHRHGGQIWVEAHVDQGASFFFTLEEDR